jgi:hypothetical protein
VEKPTTGIRVLASPEDIRQLLRRKVASAVQELLEEEISLLLGSERYERTETRNGYRNGGARRRVTTETVGEEAGEGGGLSRDGVPDGSIPPYLDIGTRGDRRSGGSW